MRSAKIASLVVVGFLVAGAAIAQQDGAAKIAFVDVERAVALIDEGKAKVVELQEWARPRQEEMGRLVKEINDLQAELQAKQGVASQDQLEELSRRLVARQRQAEDRDRSLKREATEKQDSILKELGGKMQTVIASWAQAKGYTAVFILKPSDVAYLAPTVDVTDAIIKLYNEKHPAKAAAAGK